MAASAACFLTQIRTPVDGYAWRCHIILKACQTRVLAFWNYNVGTGGTFLEVCTMNDCLRLWQGPHLKVQASQCFKIQNMKCFGGPLPDLDPWSVTQNICRKIFLRSKRSQTTTSEMVQKRSKITKIAHKNIQKTVKEIWLSCCHTIPVFAPCFQLTIFCSIDVSPDAHTYTQPNQRCRVCTIHKRPVGSI